MNQTELKKFIKWFKKSNLDAQMNSLGSGSSWNHSRTQTFDEIAKKLEKCFDVDNLQLDLDKIFIKTETEEQYNLEIKKYLKA